MATWWYPTTLSATRRHVGYSQRSGKSRYSKRRPCCVSCSVQRLRTRSVSPTTFFGRSPKVSGSMFNSTTKCPSLRFMITHSIGGVSLRQSNFRMFYLQLRGIKAPTLSETACKIPALNKEARSVNHACTLLSAAIEQHRISHTTNVFRTVYFLRKSDRLCPLDHVRHDRTVLFEERFGL